MSRRLPLRGGAAGVLCDQLPEIVEASVGDEDHAGLAALLACIDGDTLVIPEDAATRDLVGYTLIHLANAEDDHVEGRAGPSDAESRRWARGTRDGLAALSSKVWRWKP